MGVGPVFRDISCRTLWMIPAIPPLPKKLVGLLFSGIVNLTVQGIPVFDIIWPAAVM
jgi:hypothetical protein